VPESVATPAMLPFYPDGRLFVGRYGTGLDPQQLVRDLPNYVQTLPEIHERYVQEFVLRPGSGMARHHWEPEQWVELVSGTTTPLMTTRDQVFPGRNDLPVAAPAKSQESGRPGYDYKTETLTFPSQKTADVTERIWMLQGMQLVGLVNHDPPAVYNRPYVGQHFRENRSKVEDAPPETLERQSLPHRGLDDFEAHALPELRKGNELVVQTSPDTMRLLGAIRAKAECLKCHEGVNGRLLGAFTYTLRVKSEETPPEKRLADTAGLTPDALAAVAAVEKLGGTLKRDADQPGRPVVAVNLGNTKLKDPTVALLKAFPHLRELDIGYTKATPAALQLLSAWPNLQRLNIGSLNIKDGDLRHLRGLSHLRVLNLWSNEVTDAGVKELVRFPELRELYLAYASRNFAC
jgi:hypothetical protein